MSAATNNGGKRNGLGKFIKKIFRKMKLNSQISAHQKKIKQEQKLIIDQYLLIGEKVYALFVEGADVGEMFEGYCNSIKASMNNINVCRNNISNINDEKIKL